MKALILLAALITAPVMAEETKEKGSHETRHFLNQVQCAYLAEQNGMIKAVEYAHYMAATKDATYDQYDRQLVFTSGMYFGISLSESKSELSKTKIDDYQKICTNKAAK